MTPYLRSYYENFSIKTTSFIARIKTHMVEGITCNYKEQYLPNLMCNSCNVSACSQIHLSQCSALLGSNKLLTYIFNYSDMLNDENTEKEEYIATLMMTNLDF